MAFHKATWCTIELSMVVPLNIHHQRKKLSIAHCLCHSLSYDWDSMFIFIPQGLPHTLVPILVKVEDQSTWTLYSVLDQSTL